MISKTRGACWIDLPKKIESEKHSGESGKCICVGTEICTSKHKFATKLSFLDAWLLQGWEHSDQLQQANIEQRRTRFDPWLLQGWHHQQPHIEPRRTRFGGRRRKRSGKLTMTRIGKRTSSQDSSQGIKGLFLNRLGDNGNTGILLERTDGLAADEDTGCF